MRNTAVVSAFACLGLALALPAACGSKGGGDTGFGDSGGGAPDSGDDAIASGSSSGSTSSSGGILSLGDTGTSSSGGMGTGVCKNGTYSGTFQCTFVFNPDAGASSTAAEDAGGLMITGNISFNLTQMTGSGESFMSTASGQLMGTAAAFFNISADVGGSLNCNSGVFNGTLTNGKYSGFLFINGTFSGPLDSQYNGTTFSFVDGTWLLTVPGEGSCPGTWTADYAGDQ